MLTPATFDKLREDMPKELVSWRQESWAKDGKVPYIESHQAINQANAIFGFDGWSYRVVELIEVCKDEVEKDGKKGWIVGIGATVSVTVKVNDGTTDSTVTREDVGYGTGIDYSSMGLAKAYESAGKEAVSDALKRALRTFGNQFGNQLYDKSFIAILDPKPQRTASRSGGTKSSGARPDGSAATGAITENQKRFVNRLVKEKGLKLAEVLPKGKTLNDLTKAEASKVIEDLQK